MKPKVLFLHGLFSNGLYSPKVCYMERIGCEVVAPQLSNWKFSSAVKTAEETLKEYNPDLIVGSSRGGAIAMKLAISTPLILLAPAWKYYNVKNKINKPCYVIHSFDDSLVPFDDSVELAKTNCKIKLIGMCDDHRLNSSRSQKALKYAIVKLLLMKNYAH